MPGNWSLTSGLGGNAGDVIHNLLMMVLSIVVTGWLPNLITGLLMLALMLFFGLRALGVSRAAAVEQAAAAPGLSRKVLRTTVGGIGKIWGHSRDLWSRWRELRRAEAQFEQLGDEDDIIRRLAGMGAVGGKDGVKGKTLRRLGAKQAVAVARSRHAAIGPFPQRIGDGQGRGSTFGMVKRCDNTGNQIGRGAGAGRIVDQHFGDA